MARRKQTTNKKKKSGPKTKKTKYSLKKKQKNRGKNRTQRGASAFTLPEDVHVHIGTFMTSEENKKFMHALEENFLVKLGYTDSLRYVLTPFKNRQKVLADIVLAKYGPEKKFSLPQKELCLKFRRQDFSSGMIGDLGMNAFSNCFSVYFYDCFFPTEETSIKVGKANQACIENVQFLNIHHCRKIDDCHFLSKLNHVTITQNSSLFTKGARKLRNVQHLTLSFCQFYLYVITDGEQITYLDKPFDVNTEGFNDQTHTVIFDDDRHEPNIPVTEGAFHDFGHHKYLDLTGSSFNNKTSFHNIEYLNVSHTHWSYWEVVVNVNTINLTGTCADQNEINDFREQTNPQFIIIFEYETPITYCFNENYSRNILENVEGKYDREGYSLKEINLSTINFNDRHPMTSHSKSKLMYILYKKGKLKEYFIGSRYNFEDGEDVDEDENDTENDIFNNNTTNESKGDDR
jgi:hypothetical protein